ncbi:hypothetical protein BJV78DRAFT_176898 [Lactifluus subvellereus]|nr:hypothetical protein BJV78DRAFT_176898 [Lactifluus subvellereus]
MCLENFSLRRLPRICSRSSLATCSSTRPARPCLSICVFSPLSVILTFLSSNSLARLSSRYNDNLSLFSRLKQRRPSEQSRPLDDVPTNYSFLPTHPMTVLVRGEAPITDSGQELAGEYSRDHKDCFVSKNQGTSSTYSGSGGVALARAWGPLSPPWGANVLACSFIKQMWVAKWPHSVYISTSS